MSNQLVKIGRARSVWVPPVVKEYTVPRTETVASERWAYLRTEQRYVLPKGWTVIQVADRYGTSLVVLPGRRLVDGGNTEEVWYAPGGLTGPFNVAIHKRQTFASDTYVYYDTVREVLEPGYWKSQEPRCPVSIDGGCALEDGVLRATRCQWCGGGVCKSRDAAGR